MLHITAEQTRLEMQCIALCNVSDAYVDMAEKTDCEHTQQYFKETAYQMLDEAMAISAKRERLMRSINPAEIDLLMQQNLS